MADKAAAHVHVREGGPWADPHRSPHVAQVFRNPGLGYESRTDVPFQRVLTADYPELPYRRRQGEAKTVLHWGQRKLLLSEIEFLTLHGRKGHLVVYAGAAPGNHIQILGRLFPDLEFVLIDPAPFTVREAANIVCRQELFDDRTAREFAGRRVLFISDVRSVDWTRHADQQVEDKVLRDMFAQMRWHDTMAPLYSMLKFRLPYEAGETEYLAGDIHFPVWGPITTTESRLIVPGGAAKRQYDHEVYERQLFYFNTVARVGLYPHNVDALGIDHCYDCAAEVHILRQYFEARDSDSDTAAPAATASLDARVARLSESLSRECGVGRTLLTSNPDPEEKRANIRRRQWLNGVPAYEVQGNPPSPPRAHTHTRGSGSDSAGTGDEGGARHRSRRKKHKKKDKKKRRRREEREEREAGRGDCDGDGVGDGGGEPEAGSDRERSHDRKRRRRHSSGKEESSNGTGGADGADGAASCPWVREVSRKHGREFWHNTVTGKSVWVRPPDFVNKGGGSEGSS